MGGRGQQEVAPLRKHVLNPPGTKKRPFGRRCANEFSVGEGTHGSHDHEEHFGSKINECASENI